MLNKPNTKTDFDLIQFAESRKEDGLTILCGSNNSGKSFLLKSLYEKTGYTSYYLAVQRFYNAHQFSNANLDPNKRQNIYQSFLGNFRNQTANDEQNHLDLNRLITDMSDTKRATLFEICGKLLDQPFQLIDINPGNKFSPSYIEVNGINMSFTSSGTRLLITLIATLLDDVYETYYLDEPELGLTPKIQRAVVDFLYDKENRKLYFPHVKNLLISTHSHIFLDRKSINNNFTITNNQGIISINPIQDMSSFHSLQFNLLGNTFESLFLPSIIIIVEGKTDFKYIKRSLELIFPKNKLTIISANDDGAIIREVIRLKEILLDISKSPYRDRIFIITDSKHSSPSLIGDLEKHKIPKNNIIEWDSNGIEFVYPKAILAELFSCDENKVININIDNSGNININGVLKSKDELCDQVTSKLSSKTTYPDEYTIKLISKIHKIVG